MRSRNGSGGSIGEQWLSRMRRGDINMLSHTAVSNAERWEHSTHFVLLNLFFYYNILCVMFASPFIIIITSFHIKCGGRCCCCWFQSCPPYDRLYVVSKLIFAYHHVGDVIALPFAPATDSYQWPPVCPEGVRVRFKYYALRTRVIKASTIIST